MGKNGFSAMIQHQTSEDSSDDQWNILQNEENSSVVAVCQRSFFARKKGLYPSKRRRNKSTGVNNVTDFMFPELGI